MIALWRDYRAAFTATFREKFHVSPHEIGKSMPWSEACDLLEIALDDTSTPIAAALAGWRYPASIPDLVAMASRLGEKGKSVLPWEHPPTPPSEVEIRQAHDELLTEIKFGSN